MKIVTFDLDDIRTNADEVSENLNNTCSKRTVKWKVFGSIVRNEKCLFLLEQTLDNITRTYKLAMIKSENLGEMEDEILSHWQSNILTISAFEIGKDIFYALYCKQGGMKK